MQCAGNDEYCIKHLSDLQLDGILLKAREYLFKVINLIKSNDKSINISVDLLENRGFKYHTGLTFTFFSETYKGEIVKGGSYKTLSGETATGCTIYTEKIYINPIADTNNNLVYIPLLNMSDANKLIQKGFNIIFGSSHQENFDKEALSMKCKYIWKNNTLVKLQH